jgi:hypothetical protein
MTEVKVDLTGEDLAALRLVLAASERSRNNTPAWHRLRELLDSIEEQVKPAIEEPLAFASVVRVKTGSMFVRVGAMERHPWVSGECARSWDELDVLQVLRVGLGDDSQSAVDDAYLRGRRDFAASLRRQLIQLASSAVTAPEKRCYDTALSQVAALLGDS